MILQRLLVHHPESDKKIGCGIDFIMVSVISNLTQRTLTFTRIFVFSDIF